MSNQKAKQQAKQQIEKAKLLDLGGLVLSDLGLTELPDTIGDLHQLKTLDLSGNQLTELPDAIGKLQDLKWLYIENNQLTELPEVPVPGLKIRPAH